MLDGSFPGWAQDLEAIGQRRSYIWDADLLERQPLLINTPALERWIKRFEDIGIEVRVSVVRVPLETRHLWIQERKQTLDDHLTNWRNRQLLDQDRISLADMPIAEHRLEDGDFGRCIWCGEWQYADRLRLFPESLYCTDGNCELAARERAQALDIQERGVVQINRPSERQWAALRDLVQTPPGVWPLVFSCNIHRECWSARAGIHTPKAERAYLQSQNQLLDSIVRLALQRRFYGGQFAVYLDRICWMASGAVFHRF
jgi:RNA polymerase-binding transcription factor DksA